MFELRKTTAILVSVTNRSEIHGEDSVPAVSIGLKITGPNTILDSLSPTLRTTLYVPAPGQKDVPGVEPTTPTLRTEGIEYVAGSGVLEGWSVVVEHGIDDETAVVLKSVRLDKFRVAPKQGGEVEFSFRAGTANVDPRIMGLLAFKVGQEVSIAIKPPKAGAATSDPAADKALKKQREAEKAGQQRIDAPASTGEKSKAALDASGKSPFPKNGAKTDAEIAADSPEAAMQRAHGGDAAGVH